jgi:hypothetical protein
MIRYRLIEPTEWEKLKPIFDAHNGRLPNAALSTAAIAENEAGERVGMVALQPMIHAQPLWIHPEYRAKVTVRGLFRKLEELVSRWPGSRVYVFTENGQSEALAELGGMKKEAYTVFRRDF